MYFRDRSVVVVRLFPHQGMSYFFDPDAEDRLVAEILGVPAAVA